MDLDHALKVLGFTARATPSRDLSGRASNFGEVGIVPAAYDLFFGATLL